MVALELLQLMTVVSAVALVTVVSVGDELGALLTGRHEGNLLPLLFTCPSVHSNVLQ